MSEIDPAAWDWLASPQKESKINCAKNKVGNMVSKYLSARPLAKKALKNIGFNSTSNLIARFGGLIFTLMVARLLRPEGYGLYVIALSVVSLLVPMSDLGLSKGITYFVSKSLGKNKKALARGYIKRMAPVRLILTTVMAAALFFLAEPIAVGFFKKEVLINLMRLGAFLFFTQSLSVFLEGMLESVQNFKYVTIGRLLNQISKLSLVAILLYAGYLVGGVMAGMIIASAITALFLIHGIHKNHDFLIKGPKEKISNKQVFRYVKWLGIVTVSAVIYARVDSIMLGKMLAPEHAAYYGVAHAIVFTIYGVLATGKAMFPMLTQLRSEDLRRVFKKAAKYLSLVSLVVALAATVLIKPAILVLYGAEYAPAITVTYVMAPLIVVASLSDLMGSLLLVKEKTKVLAMIFLFGITLNIGLNYFFIPRWAAVGAALTTLISRSSTLALKAAFSRKMVTTTTF